MELLKNNIYMSKNAGNTATQIYINEEQNVSEANEPIQNLIKEDGVATVEGVKLKNDEVVITGELRYSILYTTEGTNMVQGLQGIIPFEGTIRMPGVDEDSHVSINITIDTIAAKVLNPRKFILKAQITAFASAEELNSQEAAVAVDAEDEVSVLKKKIEALSMVVDKTDSFRIKDEIAVPAGKPAVNKIVWKDIKIKNIATKLMDKMIHIGGEMYIFVMYTPDDDSAPQQWMESTISFGGTIDLNEVNEEMIPYVKIEIQNANLDVNTDDYGESREIAVDILLKLDIKAYEEKQLEVLSDVYSPYVNLIPVYSKGNYRKLLVKNSSRSKNTIKLDIDHSKGNILQICNSGADIKIDSITIGENGLFVDGKIIANVLYVSTNDKEPVCTAVKEEEFKYKIDAEGITNNDSYNINWRVEQVAANMISTEEVEIKAVIVIDAIVFKNAIEDVITEIREEPLNMEDISALPMIKGHIVQNGETLWELAKSNYTTIDNIRNVNDLKTDQIKKGDRLLIVKSCKR